MLLPATYDVRDWAERITGKDPVITGHLLLPEAFALSEARQVTFRRNAFSVLSEVNYFFKTGRWEAKYHDEKQIVPMVPFNFLYLINSGRQDGSLQTREDLCREMARFIALMALGREGESYRTSAINLWEGCLSQRDSFGEPRVCCSYGAGFRDLSRGALKDYFNQRLLDFVQDQRSPQSGEGAGLIAELKQNIVERLEEESARHVQAAMVELLPFHSVMGRRGMVDLPEIHRDLHQHQDALTRIRRDATDAWRCDLEIALKEEWEAHAGQVIKYLNRQAVSPVFLRAFLIETRKSIQELRDSRTQTSEDAKTLEGEARFFEEIRQEERDDSESVQRVEVWSRADKVHLRREHLKLERQELQNFARDLEERLERQQTLAERKDFPDRLSLHASSHCPETPWNQTGSFYRMSDVPAAVSEAMEGALKRFAAALFLGPPSTKVVEACLALANEVREEFQAESSSYFGQEGSSMPPSIIRERLSEMDSQVQVNWSIEGEQNHLERIRRVGCPRGSEIEPVIHPESDGSSTEGYGQVTLMKVDHGAPLHHLRWMKDYHEDFVRHAFSNQRRRANNEWLSTEWQVHNPVPGPDAEAFELFGLAARLGFVLMGQDGVYKLRGLSGEREELTWKGRAGAFEAFKAIFAEHPGATRDQILLELRKRYKNREIPEVIAGWARDAFRLCGAHREEERVDSLGGVDARIAWNEATGLDRFLRSGKWGLEEAPVGDLSSRGERGAGEPEEAVDT